MFSLINILGLSFALTVFYLLYLYISYETSYDAYHINADRIYRVVTLVRTPTEDHFFGTSGPTGPALRSDFPAIESMARIQTVSLAIQNGEKKYQEKNILIADTSLFSVFSFPLLKGDRYTALKEPFSAVLSVSAAKKYFGDADPIGKVLKLDNQFDLTVTGEMKDMPANSNFKGDIVVSMTTLSQRLFPDLDKDWNSFNCNTYLLLRKGAKPGELEAQLSPFIEKYAGKVMRDAKVSFVLSLEPLKDIYLHSKYGSPESGSLLNVRIFSVVAIIILIISSVNFINISTARSAERAKEVGIKKVAGCPRSQLVVQFLGESVVQALAAFLLACLFTQLLLPVFNGFAGKPISHSILDSFYHLMTLLAVSVVIGLLAGIYPAMVLSEFRPAVVLKGKFANSKRGLALRKVLVVTQFIISVVLIIATLTIFLQIDFMRNQPMGFKKDEIYVISFDRSPSIVNRYEAIENSFREIPNVISVSASSSVPGSGNANGPIQIENRAGDMQTAGMNVYFVDYNVVDQYQFPVVAGRSFSKDFRTDSGSAIMVNEAAVLKLGYNSPTQVIGKRFSQAGEGTVIGVIGNFHYRSLQEQIEPLVFRIDPSNFAYFSLRVRSDHLPETLAEITKRWTAMVHDQQFNGYFLSDSLNRLYKGEESFGKLILYFSLFAIFISCLGLVSLTLFSADQRAKEISVRKVLGASPVNIIGLLAREFLLLNVVALIIAAPVAWLVIHSWLQDFAYHIPISAWIFLSGGVIALFISMATISSQTIKAALAKPIKRLRSE